MCFRLSESERKVIGALKTQNMSGRQFHPEKELFVLLTCGDNEGCALWGKIFALAGMPQANLLFLARLLQQVAGPFLFAWEHGKFLPKEVGGKLPIYDQSAQQDWHAL